MQRNADGGRKASGSLFFAAKLLAEPRKLFVQETPTPTP